MEGRGGGGGGGRRAPSRMMTPKDGQLHSETATEPHPKPPGGEHWPSGPAWGLGSRAQPQAQLGGEEVMMGEEGWGPRLPNWPKSRASWLWTVSQEGH